jgi:gliding motility-associated-like protein
LNGTAISDPSTGSIIYNPNNGFVGVDDLVYQVCDNEGLCTTANLAITVIAQQHPPVAVNDYAITNINTPVTTFVLDNDYDTDGTIDVQTLSIPVGGSPLKGSLTVNNQNGTITYTPDNGEEGSDIYRYRICDNNGNCTEANVFVDIINQNHAPVALTDYAQVMRGETLTYNVTDNDTDIDNDLDITSVTVLSHSLEDVNVAVNEFGDVTLHYQESPNFVGRDTIVYRICDFADNCTADTLFVLVKSLGDEVVFVPDGFSPNDDGTNDNFVIPGIEEYPENEIHIFNRWGNIVFETQNYHNEWDGREMNSGKELPTGTYFYVLKLSPTDKPIKGYVYINR